MRRELGMGRRVGKMRRGTGWKARERGAGRLGREWVNRQMALND